MLKRAVLCAMIIGIPLMLLEVGKWGQWKYIFVFLGVPAGVGAAREIVLHPTDGVLLALLLPALFSFAIDQWVERPKH